jgi:hypothetical protein
MNIPNSAEFQGIIIHEYFEYAIPSHSKYHKLYRTSVMYFMYNLNPLWDYPYFKAKHDHNTHEACNTTSCVDCRE